MGRVASVADFEQGGLYTQYRRYPFFAERADRITARWPARGTVLVAGCGWGYLVDELVVRGWSAWGIDLSGYAITRGRREIPALAGRLHLADATNDKHMRVLAEQLAGGQFDLVVTEDMLPVFDDDEIPRALTALRGVSRSLLHIVTPGDEGRGGERHPDLNWKPIAEWRRILAPDPVLDAETGEVG